jgi:hyperosmotically inducible protein
MNTPRILRFAGNAACIAIASGIMMPLAHGADAPPATVTNPNPTHESVGTGISDTGITTQVKADLLGQKGLTSTHIHVRTRSGVVRLTGSVPSAAEKQTAADVAKAVKGVTKVQNKLSVHKA